MEALPPELILHLLSFLDQKSQVAFFSTCRYYASFASLLPFYRLKYHAVSSPIPSLTSWLLLQTPTRLPTLPSLTHLEVVEYPDYPLLFPDTLRYLRLPTFYNYDLDLPPRLETLITGCNFNRPLHLPATLLSLEVGMYYTQPLNLPPGLRTLTVGLMYNHLLSLPDGLTSLTVGTQYTQPLTLPAGLTTLHLGDNYLLPVTFPASLSTLTINTYHPTSQSLPSSLTSLTIGALSLTWYLPHLTTLTLSDFFNQPIILNGRSILPPVIDLTFGNFFNQPIFYAGIQGLPSSVKRLRFGRHFNQYLEDHRGRSVLPSGLEHLTLGINYTLPVTYFPRSLRSLEINSRVLIPLSVRSLTVGDQYVWPISGEGLEELMVGDSFNHDLLLSETKIRKLAVGWSFTSRLELPATVRWLKVGYNYDRDLVLPEGIETVLLESRIQPVIPEECEIFTNFPTIYREGETVGII